MSSYLNKSIHRFKPKAAPRRSGTVATGSPAAQISSSAERQSSQLRSTPALEVQLASPQIGPSQPSIEDPGRFNRDDDACGTQEHPSGSRGAHSTQEVAVNLGGNDSEQLGPSSETIIRVTPSTSVVESRRQLPTPDPTQIGTLQEQVANETISVESRRVPSRRPRNDAHVTQSDDSRRSEEEDDGATSATEATEPSSSRRSLKRAHIEQIAFGVIDEAVGTFQATAVTESEPEQKTRKRRRTTTPDGAERAVILPTLITMSELTRDMRQGKKSKREQRLREKDRVATAQRKAAAQSAARDQGQEFMANPSDPSSLNVVVDRTQTNGTAASTLTIRPPEPTVQPARVAPRVKVVNGQIVQDEDSRIVDRHEALVNTAGLQTGTPINAIEEDELSRLVNSGTYMKRERHTKWTSEETERFYVGLRWFGTDFNTISLMFPGRSRRQIKLKYNKEERDPARVGAVGRALQEEHCEPDLIKFQEYAGLNVPSMASIEEELADEKKKVEATQARETEALRQAAQDREDYAQKEAEASRQRGESPHTGPVSNEDHAAVNDGSDEVEADSNEDSSADGRDQLHTPSAEDIEATATIRANNSRSKKGHVQRKNKRKQHETYAMETDSHEGFENEAVEVQSAQPVGKKRKCNTQGKRQGDSSNSETTLESPNDTTHPIGSAPTLPKPRPKKRTSKAASEALYIKALAAAADKALASAAEATTPAKERRGRPAQSAQIGAATSLTEEAAEAPVATPKRRGRPPKQRRDAPSTDSTEQVEPVAGQATADGAASKPAAGRDIPRKRATAKAAPVAASNTAHVPHPTPMKAVIANKAAAREPARSPSPIEDSIVVDGGAASYPIPASSSRIDKRAGTRSAAAAPAAETKRPRGRPRKDAAPSATMAAAAAPKRPRGRPRKNAPSASDAAAPKAVAASGKRPKTKTTAKEVAPAAPPSADKKSASVAFTDEGPYTPAETIDMAEALLRAAG